MSFIRVRQLEVKQGKSSIGSMGGTGHLAELELSRLCVLTIAAGIYSAIAPLTIEVLARGNHFSAAVAEVFSGREVDSFESVILIMRLEDSCKAQDSRRVSGPWNQYRVDPSKFKPSFFTSPFSPDPL